ncbi:arsenite translocating ATPase [Gracilaria domingensis]|nr:arsenite translocating ATPase [Gracilaria domingensis]
MSVAVARVYGPCADDAGCIDGIGALAVRRVWRECVSRKCSADDAADGGRLGRGRDGAGRPQLGVRDDPSQIWRGSGAGRDYEIHRGGRGVGQVWPDRIRQGVDATQVAAAGAAGLSERLFRQDDLYEEQAGKRDAAVYLHV